MVKPATLAARNTFLNESSINVKPRLIAEWEYNRFMIPTVTVTPAQPTVDDGNGDFDDQWLPVFGDLDSVGRPFRPRTGIAKARADSIVRPLGSYRDTPQAARFYPAGYKDIYTYFGSYQRTHLSAGVDGGYAFDTPVSITLMYPKAVAVNKLVVGFETSYAKPVSYSVQVTVDGTNWFDASTDSPIATDGVAAIYWNGHQWDIPPVYDQATMVQGIRLNVYSMDTPYSHVDVLQVGARLENDLSDFIISYDVDMQVSSPSFIAPFGKASSNTANVKLSNIDGRFNTMNPDSIYYGLIEKKVRFTLDLGVDATPQSGSKYEYIREFRMWTDTWGGQSGTEVDVALKDSSIILQEQTMPSMFLENYTVGGIVCLVMDTIGMTNYAYTRSEQDNGQMIPYYWPSDTNERSNPRWGRLMVNTTPPPTSTIWDELSAMAEATQTALFFDENDVLQIVGRKQMFGSGKPVNWNLDAIQNGAKLPDVVSADVTYDLTTNQVDFTYKPSTFSGDANGIPRQEQVWQPQAAVQTSIIPSDSQSATSTTVVILASTLQMNFFAADDHFWIVRADPILWPYESDVNIEGECLHYKGKEYLYWVEEFAIQAETNVKTSLGFVPQYTVIYSDDEKATLDALTGTRYSYKNMFTAKLMVDKFEDGTLKRGLYGSIATDHFIDSSSQYTSVLTSQYNDVLLPTGGLTAPGQEGYIRQYWQPVGKTFQAVYHLRKHQSSVVPTTPNGSVWYGGKIRFTSNGIDSTPTSNWRIGGFFFAGDEVDAGYYLEVTTTNQIDGWEKRGSRHELSLFARPANAPAYQLAATTTDATGGVAYDIKGSKWAIADDMWYTVDIRYQRNIDNYVYITVYVNGVVAGVWVVPTNNQPNYPNLWHFGTHVRGWSTMDIEYLYAVADDATAPFATPDTTNFTDLRDGGLTSGFIQRNIFYNWRNINPSYMWPGGPVYFPATVSESQMVFDEFAPVVHEMRTFTVAFDPSKVPVESSFLYNTNPRVMTLYYQSDAFGAEFMLVNADRKNVIVNGTDDIPTPTGTTSINYTMFVYGRCLYTAQTDKYLKLKDDAAIRRQGLIKTQFTSRYIQTDAMATEIGNWVLELWADGVDEVKVVLFGNPFLQLGDLVTMNYPLKGMYPSTHKYFVVEIKNSFSDGYKTEATLRRCKV